jgi:hypothetical protein
MVKLPIQANRWATIGKKKDKIGKLHMVLSFFFIVVTYNHCKELAKKVTDQKIEDLRAEVSSIATDENSKQEMLKVFGLDKS